MSIGHSSRDKLHGQLIQLRGGPMHKRSHLCSLLSILIGCAFSVPALAYEESSSSSSIVGPDLAAKYGKRLTAIKEQLDNGITKGWIPSTKVDQLKQELSDVNALEADVSAKGFPKEPTNDLEKKVTALNEHITSAMSSK
jgi:hypothetical protein